MRTEPITSSSPTSRASLVTFQLHSVRCTLTPPAHCTFLNEEVSCSEWDLHSRFPYVFRLYWCMICASVRLMKSLITPFKFALPINAGGQQFCSPSPSLSVHPRLLWSERLQEKKRSDRMCTESTQPWVIPVKTRT